MLEQGTDTVEHLALAALGDQLVTAGVPFQGASRNGVDYSPEATTAQQTAGDAIFSAFDWAAERTLAEAALDDDRLSLADIRAKYQARMTQIDTDLAALAAASNAEVKQIIGRMLQAEKAELKALKAIVKG